MALLNKIPQRERAVAFVPVRLSSSRLPAKHFKNIGDRSLLSWVVERLRHSEEIDAVVICAPQDANAGRLKTFCDTENVELFLYQGDENDVVGRLNAAAIAYNADICILASGDCPLLCGDTIAKMIGRLRTSKGIDRVVVDAKNGCSPIHEGFLLARRWVWEHANQLSDTALLREHLFPVISSQANKFPKMTTEQIHDDDIFYAINHRISVDTTADLNFMNEVYQRLNASGQRFELPNVIKLLQTAPQLCEINQDVLQKPTTEVSKKVLLFVTALQTYGYGNLMRSLELARILTHRFGIGVKFVVLDDSALEIVERHNYLAVVANLNDVLNDVPNDNSVCDYQCIIVDANTRYRLDTALIMQLANKSVKLVMIDNLSCLQDADLTIVPTAHSVSKLQAQSASNKLLSGAEYVVIRQEIKQIKNKAIKKTHSVLVYAASNKLPRSNLASRLAELLSEHPDLTVDWIETFDNDYPEKLASASYLICPFGISAYEAHFLGTQALLVASNDAEQQEVDRFNLMVGGLPPEALANGALNIAEAITSQITIPKYENKYQ